MMAMENATGESDSVEAQVATVAASTARARHWTPWRDSEQVEQVPHPNPECDEAEVETTHDVHR